eukprot:Phypoly_transcript_17898.p3 GENE.Phypoly_transcript_17898~~Phypoly_transcript_17898.p3  ORF type:complete len:102 (+),score=7.50 Phypoly_transcript_17898:334-639(+)
MGDEEPCIVGVQGCPKDGRFQYNTDVVFSETGTLDIFHMVGEYSSYACCTASSAELECQHCAVYLPPKGRAQGEARPQCLKVQIHTPTGSVELAACFFLKE